MGVNGCDSFEMVENALPFTKSGFAPFSLAVPVEEQVPHSSSGWEPGCVSSAVSPALTLPFTKTKTSPEEFKPADFVLLTSTNGKPVFLAVLKGKEYMDR